MRVERYDIAIELEAAEQTIADLRAELAEVYKRLDKETYQKDHLAFDVAKLAKERDELKGILATISKCADDLIENGENLHKFISGFSPHGNDQGKLRILAGMIIKEAHSLALLGQREVSDAEETHCRGCGQYEENCECDRED